MMNMPIYTKISCQLSTTCQVLYYQQFSPQIWYELNITHSIKLWKCHQRQNILDLILHSIFYVDWSITLLISSAGSVNLLGHFYEQILEAFSSSTGWRF